MTEAKEATEATEATAATEAKEATEGKEAPAALRALIGKKVGMTQMFDESGNVRSVSVVKAGPCTIVGLRTPEKNGYSSVCLGLEEKTKNISRPYRGQFDKIKVSPPRYLKEFRISSIEGFQPGQTVTLTGRFNPGDYIDIQGISKGKGFAGGMKRHHFHGGPASHGASDRERAPGSIASRRSLGRVLPGQKMAGHMGQDLVTVAKVEVVKIVPEDNLILLNGSVPGANGTTVYILETLKTKKKRVVAAEPGKKSKKRARAAVSRKKK